MPSRPRTALIPVGRNTYGHPAPSTLAALRAGIKTVMLPKRNEKDLEDVPAEARAKLSQFTVKIGYPDRWRDYGALGAGYPLAAQNPGSPHNTTGTTQRSATAIG